MDKIGTILAPGAPVIREHIARARSAETGGVYDCCTCAGNGLPAVRSLATDQWFLLSWEEIIHLAISAGIDRAAVIIDIAADRHPLEIAQPREVAHGS